MFDEKESVSENENNDTDVSKDLSKVPSSELESLSLDNDTEDEEDDEGDLMNWEEFSQFLEDFSLCPSLFDWKSARKVRIPSFPPLPSFFWVSSFIFFFFLESLQQWILFCRLS